MPIEKVLPDKAPTWDFIRRYPVIWILVVSVIGNVVITKIALKGKDEEIKALRDDNRSCRAENTELHKANDAFLKTLIVKEGANQISTKDSIENEN